MHFVQAALYVATDELKAKAGEVIRKAQNPAELFTHLSMNYGIKMLHELGITREAQVIALEPYLDIIADSDLDQLAESCNENGWYETRRLLLDPRIGKSQADMPENIRRVFDDLTAHGHIGFVDLKIDHMLEAGASWPEVATVLRDWLAKQSAPNALEMAACALRHAGRREDIVLLEAWGGHDEQLRQTVVADTRFAVYRRRG